MDLFDGVLSALRRWYLLVPVLIITAGLAVVVHSHKNTQYVSSTSISVTSKSVFKQRPAKKGAPVITRQNALLLNGGVTLISSLLATALQEEEVERAVVAAGGTTNYSATLAQGASAQTVLPILVVQASSSSAKEVEATMSTLRGKFGPTLKALQTNAGIPEQVLAQYFVVVPAGLPERQALNNTRNTGVVIVVGVVVAFVLAGALDSILNRRRRRVPASPYEGGPANETSIFADR